MKRLFTLFILCLSYTFLIAQSHKEIIILHTNDTHSRIEPMPENLPDQELAGTAGVVRRATYIEQTRNGSSPVLLFDCGDFSQGTPYYNLFKGEVEIALMNAMGYDAATIGNHEFDFGIENLARLYRMAKFPVVCSNYDVTGTALEGLVKDYVVIEKDGIKFGIFGLSPVLEGLVQEKNCKGITFKDPIKEAQRVANILKEQEGCDVVVCLSHLGYESTAPLSDVELISQTRNIDLVLGGHSHTYFDKPVWIKNLDGKEVPVQQMGKNGSYIGQFTLTFNQK